jgi:hypothetical protein
MLFLNRRLNVKYIFKCQLAYTLPSHLPFQYSYFSLIWDSLHSHARSTLRSKLLIPNTTPRYDKAQLATKREKKQLHGSDILFQHKEPKLEESPSTYRQPLSFLHLLIISDTIPPIDRLGISASSKLIFTL